MKTAIYISGILGVLLFLLWLTGRVTESTGDSMLLISGMILLGFIFLILLLVDKHRQHKKTDWIIQFYKGKGKSELNLKKGHLGKESGLQNSPFGERKSGLTWGGGNIHGANAKRGTRRSFLK